MNLREAAQQALEALEKYDAYDRNGVPQTWFDFVGKPAITALRAAIADDRSADTGKTSDVPETNFGNMAQAVDSKNPDHVPDATKMMASVRESRTVEATIKQSLTVEPVAYVTGYFDGKCVIKPIEPVALPTGMALYRSPPKREPLSDAEINALELPPSGTATIRDMVRLIERAHGIGGEE